MKRLETDFCEKVLYGLSRSSRKTLLENSNLTDREISLLENRFVKGMTIAECSESLAIEESTFSKLQRRIFRKLYEWLNNRMA